MAKFHMTVPVMPQVMAGDHWLAANNPDGRSTENVLDRCLSSLLNQTAIADCLIHVVYHELPPLHVQSDRVVFHKVAFSRPPDIKLEEYNTLAGKVLDKLPPVRRRRIGDKYSKLKQGLRATLDDPEARWNMFVDADDMVHRDVAAYALEHDGEFSGGHTITQGYSWQAGSSAFKQVNGFFGMCGTCNVVRLSDEDINAWATTRDLHATDRKKHWLFAGHASVYKRLRARGNDTAKIPFRAAVYTVATGMNFSGINRIGKNELALTSDLRQQFGMPE